MQNVSIKSQDPLELGTYHFDRRFQKLLMHYTDVLRQALTEIMRLGLGFHIGDRKARTEANGQLSMQEACNLEADTHSFVVIGIHRVLIQHLSCPSLEQRFQGNRRLLLFTINAQLCVADSSRCDDTNTPQRKSLPLESHQLHGVPERCVLHELRLCKEFGVCTALGTESQPTSPRDR